MNTNFTRLFHAAFSKQLLLCLSIVSFTTLATSAQDCAQVNAANNLIINPSFENGTDNWNTTGSISSGAGYQICGPNGGYFYAYTDGSYNWTWQDLPAKPAGTLLTFSGYLGVHNAGLSCSPVVAIGFYDMYNTLIGYESRNITTSVDVSPYLPSLYTMTATVPAGTTYMRVAFGANGDYIKIDALSMFASAPLPVKLTNFNCTLNDSKVQVNWTAAEEINLRQYIVEKSTDGIHFTEAGTVAATNSGSYSFTDAAVNVRANGLLYYRLRSADINGKSQVSEIRLIKTGLTTTNSAFISTYPNPVTSELRITIPAAWQNKKVMYEIVNTAGVRMTQTVKLAAGQTEIIPAADLQPGFYIVKASCMQGFAQQKILKK